MMKERLATQGAAGLGANATAGWPPAFLAQGLEFFIYFILF
jgi:hypothetical protein